MKPWLLLFVTTLLGSGCVSIPNTRECTAKGRLRYGALCGESNTGKKSKMTAAEYLDYLEPKEERECAPVGHLEKIEGNDVFVKDFDVCAESPLPEAPIMKLPRRAGAVATSAEDHNKRKTALEQACRSLGNRCTYEIKQAIEAMESP